MRPVQMNYWHTRTAEIRDGCGIKTRFGQRRLGPRPQRIHVPVTKALLRDTRKTV
jgi:hypothetical protein